MPASTALKGTNRACVSSATTRASVVLQVPEHVALDGEAQRRAGRQDVLLAHDVVERPRAHALGQRRAGAGVAPRGCEPLVFGIAEQTAHVRCRRAA
jgi:hypothetical protein